MLLKNVLMDSEEKLYVDFSDLVKRIEALEKKQPETETDYISVLYNPIKLGTTATFRAWQPSYWVKETSTSEQVTENRYYDGPIRVKSLKIYEDVFEGGGGIYLHNDDGSETMLASDSGEYQKTNVIDKGEGYFTGLAYNEDEGRKVATGFGASPSFYYLSDIKTESKTVQTYTRKRIASPILYTIELPDAINYDCSAAFQKYTTYETASVGSYETGEITVQKGPYEASGSSFESGLPSVVEDVVYGSLPFKKIVNIKANIIDESKRYANYVYLGCTNLNGGYIAFAEGQTVTTDPLQLFGAQYHYSDGTSVPVNTLGVTGTIKTTTQGPDYLYTAMLNNVSAVLYPTTTQDEATQKEFGQGVYYTGSDDWVVYCAHNMAYTSDWWKGPTTDYTFATGVLEVEKYAEQNITFENDSFSHSSYPRTGIYVKKGSKMYLVVDWEYSHEIVDNVRKSYCKFVPAYKWSGIHKVDFYRNIFGYDGATGTRVYGTERYIRVPSLDVTAELAGVYVNTEAEESVSQYDGYTCYKYYATSESPDAFRAVVNNQGTITSYKED